MDLVHKDRNVVYEITFIVRVACKKPDFLAKNKVKK